ncbi:hypothetical protein [Nonomuraea basaltis]|uniref:hypothetical protein n=1 Tax=Nonomuraea basaltis TaxID=2495887 RepID=UPI0023EF9F84|nr:hypothetical protein [Nonomuraea basaltis]
MTGQRPEGRAQRAGGSDHWHQGTKTIGCTTDPVQHTGSLSQSETLDVSAVPVAQRLSHLPVIVDPSHSGGRRDLVLPLTRAAIAVGAYGVIIDVHPQPEQALCDGPQALIDTDLGELAQVMTDFPALLGKSRAAAAVGA